LSSSVCHMGCARSTTRVRNCFPGPVAGAPLFASHTSARKPMTAPLTVPGEVLQSAGIDAGQIQVLDDRIPNWRATIADKPAVLKRDWHLDESDIAWEHQFLMRLAATGFPAPRPITAFAGRSWLAAGSGLWTLVSFQRGHTLGREDQPSLGEVGRFIAPPRWYEKSGADRQTWRR
jgi:Ser/Thr protein kinase RdoA (MazF antagonist)